MKKILHLFLCFSGIGAAVVPGSDVGPALLLSPYVNENRLDEARNLSLVDPKLFLNVISYSGFFTVDEKYNSNIFFWYFPVANKVVEDTPWIIWLQGGPGATSLSGLFDEMGPFEYIPFPVGLKLRETSWWNDYSMVFIDNPLGAGFSFTNHFDGLAKDMEMYTNHLYSTLRQFLTVFPELRKAPLYIAGSSFAGRYVPALGAKINKEDVNGVNLKGLILGNPVISPEIIMDYSSVFYHWGIIDQQGLLAVKPLQDKYQLAIQNGDSKLVMNLREKLLNKLEDISYQHEFYNMLKDEREKLDGFTKFIKGSIIRNAIHVGDLGFTFSNSSVKIRLAPDFLTSSSPKIEALLEDYRILIYWYA